MKKNKLLTFYFLLFLFHFPLLSFSQALSGLATVSDKMLITLSEEGVLTESYSAEAAFFNFSSQNDADTYFKALEDNLVRFSFDNATETLTVYPKYSSFGVASWHTSDWNAYFREKAIHYMKLYQSFLRR